MSRVDKGDSIEKRLRDVELAVEENLKSAESLQKTFEKLAKVLNTDVTPDDDN